ncbi:MAG: GPR endopeptidase [Clostridia bacterium]|nr:GPR endopeptidase [Clostridia bacterium]
MHNIRTDMAYEAHRTALQTAGGNVEGVNYEEYNDTNISASKIEILNGTGEKSTGKPCGKYITAKIEKDFTPQYFKSYSEFLALRIKELLPSDYENVLIAGLGNRFITADSIGPKAVSHIIVTRHIKSICPSVYRDLSLSEVAALAPGVLAQTGIESGVIIKSIIDDIHPECLIVIDALATRNFTHLSRMIQLSDYGIHPGSGVHNSRLALTRENMGIPVISIGVPTVIDASAFAADIVQKNGLPEDSIRRNKELECFITLKESDIITDNMAKLIGYSVNLALHQTLSYEEMVCLCS